MAALDTERRLLAELTALQAAGPQPCDPVGLHYMTQLAQRLPTQPGPVRRLLVDKLDRAMLQYREKHRQSQPATKAPVNLNLPTSPGNAVNSVTTLTELNRYIISSTTVFDDKPWMPVVPDCSEMKSVRYFKQVWQRIKAEDQVAQAVLQSPKNPGPINSHMLVLRTLTLMRQLSPAYLQRFLAQADALLSLDRATAKPSVTESKARSRGRMKRQAGLVSDCGPL